MLDCGSEGRHLSSSGVAITPDAASSLKRYQVSMRQKATDLHTVKYRVVNNDSIVRNILFLAADGAECVKIRITRENPQSASARHWKYKAAPIPKRKLRAS